MSQTFGPTRISPRWPMVRRYCSGAFGHPELFRLHLRRKTAITRAGMLAGQGLDAMAAQRTNSTSRYVWERDPDFRWRWWFQDQAYAWRHAPAPGRQEWVCWGAAIALQVVTHLLQLWGAPTLSWSTISFVSGVFLGRALVLMSRRVKKGRER